MGAYIVFIDESGVLLIPPMLRTWAPRGKTPLHRHSYKREKISLISGLTISPRRHCLGLYFHGHLKNIQQAEACQFLRHLLRHLHGHVIVIWDNGRSHGGELIRKLCKRHPRLHLYRFPSYAPEINPDEGIWRLTKRALANGRPEDQLTLADHLVTILEDIRSSKENLRACVKHSGLPFF